MGIAHAQFETFSPLIGSLIKSPYDELIAKIQTLGKYRTDDRNKALKILQITKAVHYYRQNRKGCYQAGQRDAHIDSFGFEYVPCGDTVNLLGIAFAYNQLLI